MSKSRRDLTGEEKRLWREVAKTVRTQRPLAQDDESPSSPSPPKQISTRKSEAAAPRMAAKRQSAEAPANRGAEKKVRRGKVQIDAKLDLHGHTQDRAQAALERFLHAAHARGDRMVMVITGVGRGGDGIIRRRFTDWIAARTLREVVAGYAPAHRTHGGAGAFYVFLKRGA